MILMNATTHVIAADQVIVVMVSMGESVLVHELARQCRRSWKIPPTCDFDQESLLLRRDRSPCGRRNSLGRRMFVRHDH